ncbi:hypothetical protein ACI3EY_16700 [Ornithinimicrobium sp. LYQ92]|uniref:hypothetical protein n=1 Tax=Serinicoccus sp. LYQ92 TaxID=3378798 RepID=UPI0038543FD3
MSGTEVAISAVLILVAYFAIGWFTAWEVARAGLRLRPTCRRCMDGVPTHGCKRGGKATTCESCNEYACSEHSTGGVEILVVVWPAYLIAGAVFILQGAAAAISPTRIAKAQDEKSRMTTLIPGKHAEDS